MQQTPFELFIAPPRRRPQIWRLVLGVVIVIVCAMAWVAGLLAAIWLDGEGGAVMAFAQDLGAPETPVATLVLLATFIAMALGPVVAVRLLHDRRPGTLFGPRARVRRDFVTSAAVVFAIYGAGIAFWLLGERPEAGLAPGLWLLLLPLGLAGIAVQTMAEELIFRGYLMQQLAARFRSPAVWFILPALAFGAMHYDPSTAGENWWLIVGSTTLFGLIAADLTVRTGSLGAAWGFHFANNVVALLIIATKGTITGLAVFLTPYAVDDPDLPRWLLFADMGLLVVAWLVVRRLTAPR
ncbi:CPBP family intramembrane glutamic endopeptidase [Oceaniglobus indicus]|uniref:CPBP family intramembrane glutamic endopeptidase n=1 Tax=Oceaniglobus indicus TaxID=2047749 RepID=UPI000C19CFDB|nr:type II CAAX endopeptidase family protein [Oceaniglobus indicus]